MQQVYCQFWKAQQITFERRWTEDAKTYKLNNLEKMNVF